MPVRRIVSTDSAVSFAGNGYFGGSYGQPITLLPSGESILVSGETLVLRDMTQRFGNGPIRKADYSSVVENVDFAYGKRLDASVDEDPDNGFGSITGGMIDANPSGEFPDDKHLRLFNSGVNIAASGENQKTIYAWDLSTPVLPSGSSIVYVDPIRSRISSVGALFHDRCENVAMSSPVISPGAVTYEGMIGGSYGSIGVTQLKFGNGIYSVGVSPGNTGLCGGSVYNGVWRWTLPFNVPTRGTLSVWVRGTVSGTSDCTHCGQVIFGYGSPLAVGIYGRCIWSGCDLLEDTSIRCQLAVNSSIVSTYGLSHGELYHLYVVWDGACGLSSGRSVMGFINGSLAVHSSVAFDPTSSPMYVMMEALGYYQDDTKGNITWSASYNYFDNLQVYAGVLSEDPGVLYNGGVGVESSVSALDTADYRRVRGSGTVGIIQV